jgi:hypothetical protein
VVLNTGLEIKPFNDYWIDCIINAQISIVTSREPSLRYMTYLNDYGYEIVEMETEKYDMNSIPQKIGYFLVFKYMNEVFPKYVYKYFSFEPFNFRNQEYGFEKLKELIKHQKLIAVGVDMFYWIPESYCWNKHHFCHYSAVTGFDEARKVFFVLDVNLKGFDCFEIPEERFCQAVKFYRFSPDAYIVTVAEDIEQFQLTLPEVVYYTKKLKQNLESIDIKALLDLNAWIFQKNDWFNLFTTFVQRLLNRQTANILLFNALHEQSLIRDPDIISGLVQQADNLKKQWQIFEQEMVKQNCLSPDQVNSREFCDQCNRLFQLEMEMWNVLLAYEVGNNSSISKIVPPINSCC